MCSPVFVGYGVKKSRQGSHLPEDSQPETLSSKCAFMQCSVEYPGYRISCDSLLPIHQIISGEYMSVFSRERQTYISRPHRLAVLLEKR